VWDETYSSCILLTIDSVDFGPCLLLVLIFDVVLCLRCTPPICSCDDVRLWVGTLATLGRPLLLIAMRSHRLSPMHCGLRRGVLATAYMQEEVERLEKIKQEFVEVDGDDSAPDDADMMAELRKRLAAEAAAGSDPTDATATDDPDAPPTPPPVAGSDKS